MSAAPTPWVVGKTNPIKQSNYGVYKQVISTGEGMGLRRVTITGDTAETVQEVALNAAAAPDLLHALKQAHFALESVYHMGKGNRELLPYIRLNQAAIKKAEGK